MRALYPGKEFVELDKKFKTGTYLVVMMTDKETVGILGPRPGVNLDVVVTANKNEGLSDFERRIKENFADADEKLRKQLFVYETGQTEMVKPLYEELNW